MNTFTGGRRGGDAMASLRSRLSKSGGNTVGTLDELKGLAKTPADLQRIHMDADGRYYLPDYDAHDTLLAASGMGHLAMPKRAPVSAGSRAGAQQMGNLVKYGVEMGPYWNDVADLNRGRAATGYGAQFDPLKDFAQAAQQGASAYQRAATDAVTGNAAAADQAQRTQTYQQNLARGGVDTARMQSDWGDDWTRVSPEGYRWGSPTTGLQRRGAALRAR